MNLHDAIRIVKEHNRWRRYGEGDMEDPRLIGEAIDTVLHAAERVAKEDRQDTHVCPKCGGPADNGHDRGLPPTPYLCTKCEYYSEYVIVPHDRHVEILNKHGEVVERAWGKLLSIGERVRWTDISLHTKTTTTARVTGRAPCTGAYAEIVEVTSSPVATLS